MATQEELVGMDSTIEALKGQITAAREELKNLNSGILPLSPSQVQEGANINCSSYCHYDVPAYRRNSSSPHRLR